METGGRKGGGLLGRSGKERDLLSVSEFEDKIGIYFKESCWAQALIGEKSDKNRLNDCQWERNGG